MPPRKSVGWAAALIVVAACRSPIGDLPEIAEPLGYETVRVELPGCATRLPPVRDSNRCGASEIGNGIDPNDVCLLLTGLQTFAESEPAWVPSTHHNDWPQVRSVHAEDWSRVRAVCVTRHVARQIIVEQASGKPGTEASWPLISSLWLEADIPHLSVILSVRMSEQSRERTYSVAPRERTAFTILSH
jgi:hypothetical protein